MLLSKMTIDCDGIRLWEFPGDRWHREDEPVVGDEIGYKAWCINGRCLDEYCPNLDGFEPSSRAEALEWADEWAGPYSRELYLADIDRMFPERSDD